MWTPSIHSGSRSTSSPFSTTSRSCFSLMMRPSTRIVTDLVHEGKLDRETSGKFIACDTQSS